MRAPALLTLALLCPAATQARGQEAATATPRPNRTVVFVCEHGNVKSLVAQQWFNRLAEKRGSELRAVSRGMRPEPAVPVAIAGRLRDDGFDVAGFVPAELTSADLATAIRVVAIGVDTSPVTSSTRVPVETWREIPPASEQYEASRDALRRRMLALLDDLEAEPRP
jgi:protein-tyrosine-phosphatase